MNTWERKADIIRQVQALALSEVDKKEADDLARFIEGFYSSSAPDDLISTPIEELLGQSMAMWKLAKERREGTTRIKVFNPSKSHHGWKSNRTFIMVVNDDMPFLVDSITAELTNQMKLSIYSLHHPVFYVERDKRGGRTRTVGRVGTVETSDCCRESYILIEVDLLPERVAQKDLKATIGNILSDVRLAVEDWKPILSKLDVAIDGLGKAPKKIDPIKVSESKAFLEWMKDDHFTLIGYRRYAFEGNPQTASFRSGDNDGLGILRDPQRRILRGPRGLTRVSAEIRDFLSSDDPLIVTKANVRTCVHRPVHLDYIGVKIYNDRGKAVGEHRFVGLFTSMSYMRRAQSVPLLRVKMSNIQERATFDPLGHAGKALTHIMETFPRDELYQIDENSLYETCLGILHLSQRPHPKAFIRRDKHERFVTALVYVPRDKYHSGLRVAIEKILCDAFNGEVSVTHAQLSDDVMARWLFILRTFPGRVLNPSQEDIDRQIAEAAKDWSEHLHETLVRKYGENRGNILHAKYRTRFSGAYREAFQPHQASSDIAKLDALSPEHNVNFEIYRLVNDAENALRLKIYNATDIVPLSECLPILENLGFRVMSEHGYDLYGQQGGWIHDFFFESLSGEAIEPLKVKSLIEELLEMTWQGAIEDDGLNMLAVRACFSWKEIVVLRAYAKYLRQIGLPFSSDYVEDCMVKNAHISRMLVDLFTMMFDPSGLPKKQRFTEAHQLADAIRTEMDKVSSLDHDRILRGYLSVILATLRTNFYQKDFWYTTADDGVKPGLALKIRSQKVSIAPEPRPYAEIFIYAPHFEGVHLRGGPVARGGLRWSDRREDFRTEVLGLVKAQQVKNAVIVPVGAKGGFVPKLMPENPDRETFMSIGTACYKGFIKSLLSVTDNLIDGQVVSPKRTVRWDKGDPYLVVAADKGTATFSDIANGLAQEHGFWLGDAFASGGSVGYDHKKMAITARGAWVGVQRHFREIGVNIQEEPINVIGVGDMSGDVFGNGMLLSRVLRLQAAFDHRNIFFDPDPDLEASFLERERLFNLPRSSWEDYNKKLISKGGGVFDRKAKTIALTKELKTFLGTTEDSMSPNDVINRILKTEVDLLWFGGIGTYVRATTESQADAGDRANDPIRVTARDLRVKVVGEGGNLGMTQRARIEFGRHGGRVNSDFIDNSAGVDCSDKEVNIKILMADAMANGRLKPKARVKLLADMTDEVADIVLEDNYLQTQAISIAEAEAIRKREQHQGLIRVLERDGLLNREIETLPSDDIFAQMATNNAGLTRPELSILISYIKMSLTGLLLKSDLMNHPLLLAELQWGFPKRLRKRYGDELNRHQLRSEIVATTLANQVVNRGGLTFVYEVKEETGLAIDEIISAYLIVREVYGLNALWAEIDTLDYKVSSDIQMRMHREVSELLKQQAIWFLHNTKRPHDIEAIVSLYREGLNKLMAKPDTILSQADATMFHERRDMYVKHGVPSALAHRVAALQTLGAACDIVQVSEDLGRNIHDVGQAYYDLGSHVGFNWLRRMTETMTLDNRWDYLAVRAVIDDIADQQRDLTRRVLGGNGSGKGAKALHYWMREHRVTLGRAERLISDINASGGINVAKLSFAVRHLRSILPSGE